LLNPLDRKSDLNIIDKPVSWNRFRRKDKSLTTKETLPRQEHKPIGFAV
jgi:hypothetical protein